MDLRMKLQTSEYKWFKNDNHDRFWCSRGSTLLLSVIVVFWAKDKDAGLGRGEIEPGRNIVWREISRRSVSHTGACADSDCPGYTFGGWQLMKGRLCYCKVKYQSRCVVGSKASGGCACLSDAADKRNNTDWEIKRVPLIWWICILSC